MCRLEEGPPGTHSAFLLEGAQTQSHRRQERLCVWMHSSATRIDLPGGIKTYDKGGKWQKTDERCTEESQRSSRRCHCAETAAHSEEHPIILDERVQYPSNKQEEKHACSAVSSTAPRSSTLQPYFLSRVSALKSVGHRLNPSAPAILFIL